MSYQFWQRVRSRQRSVLSQGSLSSPQSPDPSFQYATAEDWAPSEVVRSPPCDHPHIPAKAARVAQPGCLWDGRQRAGRWRGLGDSAVNLVPYKLIRFVVDNSAQERLGAVEVEVIGDDSRAEPR
jgi:hypothetical protein